jgi:thiamine-phosphate pyrophosphorylase
MVCFADAVDVYPVTGRDLFRGRPDEEIIAALAAGGARIIQLREKRLSDRELYELSLLYRKETLRHDMLLIINDRPDVALLCGADGVHLGQGDLPIREVRKLLGPGAIIGGSAHSPEEAERVEAEGATYVNIGPIFPTITKPGVHAIGLEALKETISRVGVPVTCMGGITEDNIGKVLAAGARHIGMVGAIFGQADVAAAVARLARLIKN